MKREAETRILQAKKSTICLGITLLWKQVFPTSARHDISSRNRFNAFSLFFFSLSPPFACSLFRIALHNPCFSLDGSEERREFKNAILLCSILVVLTIASVLPFLRF